MRHYTSSRPAVESDTLFRLIIKLKQWSVQSHEKLRIGLHVGPVSLYSDINRRPNICGNTINVCQRVMDSARPGEVLLSEDAFHHYFSRDTKTCTDKPFSAKMPAYFDAAREVVVKHGWNLNVFAMHCGVDHSYWPPFLQDPIHGRIERTKFIVEKLRSVLAAPKSSLTVYEQSAFSTFGMLTSGEELKKLGDHDPDYLNLLGQQRELLDKLAHNDNVEFKLLVFPIPQRDMRVQGKRFKNLLDWMREPRTLRNPAIDWAFSKQPGPNRLIVSSHFCIEGQKAACSFGYDESSVSTRSEQIDLMAREFTTAFEAAKVNARTKLDVIRRIQARYQESAGFTRPKQQVRYRR